MQELNDMNNLKHKSLCFRVRWEKNIKKIIAHNEHAMSSGGFGTAHHKNTTNDNRKHER